MTHAERILELLNDGQPHSHLELYALGTVAHSRISDLRKKGHLIRQWRDGDLYLYQLEECPARGPAGGRSQPQAVAGPNVAGEPERAMLTSSGRAAAAEPHDGLPPSPAQPSLFDTAANGAYAA